MKELAKMEHPCTNNFSSTFFIDFLTKTGCGFLSVKNKNKNNFFSDVTNSLFY